MKLVVKYFPEYTLHDEIHILRMLEIIELIIDDSSLKLNYLEITILIISVIFHDIGMVPSEDQYNSIINSNKFKLFRDEWILNHPNYSILMNKIQQGHIPTESLSFYANQISEIDQAIISEYLRTQHAYNSGEFVRNNYNSDKRIEAFGLNLSEYIAKLCISHAMQIELITPKNGYNFDERIGCYSINMPFLAILLRLADILDFDRERTPDILFQSIHFTNKVSQLEWEKHRAVHGWIINQNEVRFDMSFEHPVYESVARKFLDIIDAELISCHIACKNFPQEFSDYKLLLPQRVDRQRIGAKNNAYLYFDLEFSLSRNEIVNLLMTNNLYGSPSLCVRELLQNSADAVRLRTAQFKQEEIDWKDGKIIFEHFIDENNVQVLKCQDNGIGMDENIIQNYFTKVGRSYYRSPEFTQLQLKLKESNADFDPCSQFGIGFMSTFMLGDKIKIVTRKDYGQGKEYGKPLIIEINGTSGIIVIREGESSQSIGTAVYIYCRDNPNFFDEFSDKIRLSSVLRGYALGIEYPIFVKNKIIELEEDFVIEPGIKVFPSRIDKLQNHLTISKSFQNYDPLLNGSITESFIVNDNGNICISNDLYEWKIISKGPNIKKFEIETKDGEQLEIKNRHSISVCLDGVLVAGNPGRPGDPRKVRMNLGWRNSNIDTHANCCIDIRGFLKPEITPARIPVEQSFNRTQKWERINDYVINAEADIWNDICKKLFEEKATPEVFWKLAVIYSTPFQHLSYECIVSKLYFPLIKNEKKEIVWKKLQDIGQFKLIGNSFFDKKSNSKIMIPDELANWSTDNHYSLQNHMESIIISSSNLVLDNDQLYIDIDFLQSKTERPSDYIYKGSMVDPYLYFIGYKNVLNKYLSVGSSFRTINKNHQLSKLYLQNKYLSNKDNFQKFCFDLLLIASMIAKDKSQITNIRWLKHIGHLYFSINWDQQNIDYKPPYFLRDKDGEEIVLDEQIFDNWKNLEIPKEKFIEEPDFDDYP